MSEAQGLEFERPLVELERRIDELKLLAGAGADLGEDIRRLEGEAQRLQEQIFRDLTPWQKVQLSRHPRRPLFLEYVALLFSDFIELHGDRTFGDDPAIVGGLAAFRGTPALALGHQKGRTAKENVYRSFGMPRPEGYRKAVRLMELAERFRRPILTFIDTPGAYPGLEAEERGQAEAIARCLACMARLTVPLIAVVTGEGGSGGALALALGNRVLMLENAVYSVISPEGCASILWKDAGRAAEAAAALRLTSQDLLRLGVVDEVVPEGSGGAHRDPQTAARHLGEALGRHLGEVQGLSPEALRRDRHDKFRRMGVFRKA